VPELRWNASKEREWAGTLGRVHLALNLLDPKSLLHDFGTAGVIAIIFAETGLLIGFFMPGDSLLFTAGLFTAPALAKGYNLSLPLLLVLTPIAAIAGAQLGHYLGAKAGAPLFERPDSKVFRKEFVDRAEYYFERFGAPKAVILARFVPIVRTFLNPVAGVLGMRARQFFLWNVIGGLAWTEAILLIGHFLGQRLGATFPIDRYLIPTVIVIVILSLIPVIREVIKMRRPPAPSSGAAGSSATGSPERWQHRSGGQPPASAHRPNNDAHVD
jgi:membrane-associated protein